MVAQRARGEIGQEAPAHVSPERKSFVAQRARGEIGQEAPAHMSPERKS